MRFVNVGKVFARGRAYYLDLEVTNSSTYTPSDVTQNTMNGRYLQVNVGCDSSVQMRATIKFSCNRGKSCTECDQLSGSAKTSCYQAGCYCFGTQVFGEVGCSGASYETLRSFYTCPQKDITVPLAGANPDISLLSVSLYDLDRTADLIEKVSIFDYEYTQTPLRAVGFAEPGSTTTLTEANIDVTGTSYSRGAEFTATAYETPNGLPTDPTLLTTEQATKGLQVYFEPRKGYVETVLSVSFTGSGTCTGGRPFLFAGDAALCAPPPSPPPVLPPPLPSVPPISPSPPPFPPPPCTMDMPSRRRLSLDYLEDSFADRCDFGLIVKHDASIASHTHHKGIAVGGNLRDISPTQPGLVSGTSYVKTLTAGHGFQFSGGINLHADLPVDFTVFENVATLLQPMSFSGPGGRTEVHVRCNGGIYTFDDFCPNCYNPGGTNFLVVFNTAETVRIRAAANGKKWLGSILAPFAEVVVDGTAGFIDGQIIARYYREEGTSSGSLANRGNCFQGVLSCAAPLCAATTALSSSGPSTAGLCYDAWSRKKCRRKFRKNKCHKKKVKRKCAAKCGLCVASPLFFATG